MVMDEDSKLSLEFSSYTNRDVVPLKEKRSRNTNLQNCEE